jgi:hypothetical protein
MKLAKSILTAYNDLKKSDEKKDAQKYKKRALSGMDLMYPVKIKGQTHRPDNNIAYHSTIKLFNPKSDSHTDVHETASQMEFHKPNPAEMGLEHVTFQGKEGDTIYAIKLTGPHAQKMKRQHKEFDHLGHDESYEFHPHVSVDKDTWERTKGARTAHEAGIEFGKPELRQGNKILSRYVKKSEKSDSLKKSDNPHGIEPAHAHDFHSALSAASPKQPHISQNVEPHSKEALADMKTYLSADKKSGYAIKPNGELTSVFSSEKGRGNHLVSHAISQGANHLNAFEGHLTNLYSKHGFKEHKREKNWDPKGPDVVHMKLNKMEPLMKPYSSEAQRRWAHTPNGEKALGGKKAVHEWDEATKGKKLPEKLSKSEGALKYYHRMDLPKNVRVPAQHRPSAEIGKEVGENHRLNTIEDIHYAVKNNKVVGHVGQNEHGQVQGVYVDPQHRRQGIAEGLYHHIANTTGSILSDEPSAMEPGAKGLWNKLKNKYPNRVKQTKTGFIFNKSEKNEEALEKGAIKNLGAGLAMVAGLHGAPKMAQKVTVNPSKASQTQNVSSQYSPKRMLSTIAAVESSKGRDLAHAAVPGQMHHGEQAYGKYALMPQTIRETIGMNRDLRSKYGKATKLHGQDLYNFMRDNKGLEDQIASKHLQRLEHHFGQDPAKIGRAWIGGISGTNKAIKNNEDIKNHWHVLKVLEAYDKEK